MAHLLNNATRLHHAREATLLTRMLAAQDKLGLAAEHGYFMKLTTGQDWEQQYTKGGSDFAWKEMVEPILEVYKDSTDGTYIESKESALVWHYQNADPDFGSWQV